MIIGEVPHQTTGEKRAHLNSSPARGGTKLGISGPQRGLKAEQSVSVQKELARGMPHIEKFSECGDSTV